jgi:hypothetical protein
MQNELCPIGDTQTVCNEIDQYLRIEGKTTYACVILWNIKYVNSYFTKIGTIPIMEWSAFKVDLLLMLAIWLNHVKTKPMDSLANITVQITWVLSLC